MRMRGVRRPHDVAWGRVMYLARDDYAAPAALRMSSIPACAPEDSS